MELISGCILLMNIPIITEGKPTGITTSAAEMQPAAAVLLSFAEKIDCT